MQKLGKYFALVICLGFSAQAADNRPATMDQYNDVLRYLKESSQWMNYADKKIKDLTKQLQEKSGKGASEETVDLNALPEPPSVQSTNPALSPHHASVASPIFKVFFDFNMYNRPGFNQFTFDNFHNFLLFEIMPTSDLQFAFDVNPSPRYYELDYQATSHLQLRVGKIWIPFDDMAPHNMFGGRINVSKLSPIPPNSPQTSFLPDLWTDLGVGARYQLVESSDFDLFVHAYVLNGFQGGATDPLNPSNGSSDAYPTFGPTLPTGPDNNRDKAIGGRVNCLLFRKLGLGASFYTGQWSSDADPHRLNMFGLDGQFRIGGTEFRAGWITMRVGIDSSGNPATDYFNRGADYLEVGQKFGKNDEWKVLARTGAIQFDDRLVSITDQTLLGMTVVYKPGLIEYSAEYSQDLHIVPGKLGYSFLNFRLVVAI